MVKNLILLHGFCETKEMWDDIIPQFSNEIDVYCLDLPGFGDFPFDVKGMSIEDIAEVVHTEIKKLDIDDFCLVGHSLGGYIAIELAKKFPSKIKGLGLFHSSVFADTQEKIEKRNSVIDFLQKHGAAVFVKSFIPQLFIPKHRERCQKQIERLIQHGIKLPDSTLVHYTKAMQTRNDNSVSIEGFNMPVLFIIGKQDESVPLDISTQQVSLPKFSTSIFLDECGHMGMFEQQKQTKVVLKSFVKNCYF